MRVLYVSQYFPPEMGAPAARVYDLARLWAAQGCCVTVLTGFPNHPTGAVHPDYRKKIWRLFVRERVAGVELLRGWLYPAANKGRLKRCLNYFSFMLSAIFFGTFCVRRPDVIIATSPQLLVGLAGYALARLWRVPLVFEVRDLWPESLIAVEAVRPESGLIRALDRVAMFLYREAASIVTVTDAFKRIIVDRGIDSNKIHVIKNGVDLQVFHPGVAATLLPNEWGVHDRFVISYIGTLGMAHKIDTILDVAERLRILPDIRFVLVGEGAEKDALKAQAVERRLSNVIFLDQQPRPRVAELIAASQVGLVLLRRSELFRTVIPSKMFEYMGMAKPIILGVPGESQAILEQAGAGLHIPSEDVSALETAILTLYHDGRLRARLGANGRRYVECFHDREKLAANYTVCLKEIVYGPAVGSESPTATLKTDSL
ncbi:MAG: glycosyltransferase family 4 protein [Acidobacteria bacterium]|nr:glycosyltransferase family 4 protein [Acidobacteriota bacterium]MBI3656387.1 glycosyltransferase family 4 protein [Acidobacteriota bacterium]